MSQANQDFRAYLSLWAIRAILTLPIAVGIVHQLLMFMFDIERIYVLLDPPGYISPWASVQFLWWIMLLVVAGGTALLIYLNQLPSVPHRVVYPLYIYVVFLLIFIKPV
jgi:hypothetical protein